MLREEKKALASIEQRGILLVFPIRNRKEPPSLWSELHPRKQMRWEWDESGQKEVPRLWHLRGELSTSRKVVYTKWYQGRATFISRPVFTAMLHYLGASCDPRLLGSDASRILEILKMDSPLSPKILRPMTELQGRDREREYARALRKLWEQLLIVAFGEVEDSSFPSLAVGATEIIFEDLWMAAKELTDKDAFKILQVLPGNSLFLRQLLKLRGLRAAKKFLDAARPDLR